MSVMKFRRFTKPQVLKQVGRELLGRFFERFNGKGSGIGLPLDSASDEDYFQGVAKVLMSPEGLPDEVGEALYLVDEMANEEGRERLNAAAAEAGLKLNGDGNPTQAELALEVFLADPKVLDKAHSEQKLVRLTSFEYYGGKRTGRITEANGGNKGNGDGTNGTHGTDGSDPSPRPSPLEAARERFEPPGPEVLLAMAKSLDEWFAQHNRGKQTARVDVHLIDGEYFFIIRHG